MRHQGHDDSDRDRVPETGPIPETEEVREPLPLDAAESAWDPWLWALYLREVAERQPPTLH